MDKDGWWEDEREFMNRFGNLVHFQPTEVRLKWNHVSPEDWLIEELVGELDAQELKKKHIESHHMKRMFAVFKYFTAWRYGFNA